MALPTASAITELFKPITWFPPMWAFACGVIASGVPMEGRWMLALVGVALAGPFVCATSQAVNDWFDRHVDAINEPQRPIPSGRMPGQWGLFFAILWTVASLLVALVLGPWGFAAAAVGLALAWAYSAPPVRLKENGWWGNAACGISYEGIAWTTGAAVMAGGLMPGRKSLWLALLYSIGTHGIMTLNDFKAVKGDREMGVRSLPVQLGEQAAGEVACWIMALPQAVVILLLFAWGKPAHGVAIFVLLTFQLAMMDHFLASVNKRALWYSGFGVPLFVSGMMVSAFAVRGLVGGAA
jgi:chlorophyll synthase